ACILVVIPGRCGSALFPYTTLFRSGQDARVALVPVNAVHEQGQVVGIAAEHAAVTALAGAVVVAEVEGPPCLLGLDQVALAQHRSEEHTSELQSVRISYAVFCLKKT